MTAIGAPRDRAHSAPEWRAYVRETCVEIIRRARAEGIGFLWRNTVPGLWAPRDKVQPDVVGYVTSGSLRGQLVALELERRTGPKRPALSRAWELALIEADGLPLAFVYDVESALERLGELASCPLTRAQFWGLEPFK